MEWRYSKAKMRFQSLFMSTTVHLFSTSAAKACRADDRIVPPSSLRGKSTPRHGPPSCCVGTHRVAISNRRLIAADDGAIAFSVISY